MRMLITDATGLLGNYLLRELQQRSEQIRVPVLIVEKAQRLKAQGKRVLLGGITDSRTSGLAVNSVETERPVVTQASQYISFERV